jgi:hypothetical protein
MPVKKTSRLERSNGSAQQRTAAEDPERPAAAAWTMSPQATLLVAVCVIGVVMLVAVRRLTVPVESATVTVESPEHAEILAPAAELLRERVPGREMPRAAANDATPAVTIEPPAVAVLLEASPARNPAPPSRAP